MEQPNQLWQMDFKGYFALEEGGYCHPLTILDAHSRFFGGYRPVRMKSTDGTGKTEPCFSLL